MNINYTLIEDWNKTFQRLEEERPDSRIFILMDSGSKKYCLPILKPFLPKGTHIISIGSGEENKKLISCEKVWNILTSKKADRNSILINFGGGMIGDLGGFCAAVYKRGIDFIQIPTTLLAMVDACLGGKTGVDFQNFKNQIGAFQQPNDIWIDPNFLKTLPEKELLSGFAEVIKHGLIADVAIWNTIRKRDLEYQNWMQIIPEALAIKKSIVLEDPFEKGARKKLNAGHTIGHAIETHLLNRKSPSPHGHCIAAGLVMESFISMEKGYLPEPELIQIEELVYSYYGIVPVSLRDKKSIWNLALQDKKNQNAEVRMSLIGPIGNCQYEIPVTQNECDRAIEYYLGKL